jgi:cytochrome c-type biogenesis protein CcmH/NrfG
MRTQIALVLALTLGIAAPAFAVGSSSSSDSPYNASSDDYQKAVRAIEAEKYQQAVSLLESVVRNNPRNADAWNYLGFGERKLAHFDRSLAAYRKALRIEPDHLGANEYLGELYLQTGQPELAKEQLRKLEALCPGGCEEYRDLEQAIRASTGG